MCKHCGILFSEEYWAFLFNEYNDAYTYDDLVEKPRFQSPDDAVLALTDEKMVCCDQTPLLCRCFPPIYTTACYEAPTDWYAADGDCSHCVWQQTSACPPLRRLVKAEALGEFPSDFVPLRGCASFKLNESVFEHRAD